MESIRAILGDEKANEFQKVADDYLKSIGSIQHTFRDLKIGQTFDFVNEDDIQHVSFFIKCRKVGIRKYTAKDYTHEIGEMDCKVYHVGRM
jgi:hypothetical protein